MNQERFGEFIKQIRKKNNLTKKQLADKYNVTYQTVSKWENGKNIPDISLLKEMSKDFNTNIEDILDGNINNNNNNKNKNYKNILLLVLIIIILIPILFFGIKKINNNFEFKTISSSSNEFILSGSIAYNSNKSSIYITNINYKDQKDKTIYKEIECILYETYGNTETKISTKKSSNIDIETFLKQTSFHINNYKTHCKEYTNDSLYLEINAKDMTDKITKYKVPLSLEDKCK